MEVRPAFGHCMLSLAGSWRRFLLWECQVHVCPCSPPQGWGLWLPPASPGCSGRGVCVCRVRGACAPTSSQNCSCSGAREHPCPGDQGAPCPAAQQQPPTVPVGAQRAGVTSEESEGAQGEAAAPAPPAHLPKPSSPRFPTRHRMETGAPAREFPPQISNI